jgi:hypothetical protein
LPASGKFARRAQSEAFETAKAKGSAQDVGYALLGYGVTALLGGGYRRGEDELAQAAAAFRMLGDSNLTTVALAWLALADGGRGNLAGVCQALEECFALGAELLNQVLFDWFCGQFASSGPRPISISCAYCSAVCLSALVIAPSSSLGSLRELGLFQGAGFGCEAGKLSCSSCVS